MLEEGLSGGLWLEVEVTRCFVFVVMAKTRKVEMMGNVQWQEKGIARGNSEESREYADEEFTCLGRR